MSKKRNLVILLFVSIICACAQVENDAAESLEMKTLNAFVRVYYPDAMPIDSQDTTKGYYKVICKGGTEQILDSCQLSLDYSVHTPSEIKRISKVTIKEQAELYGLFSYDQHYVPERLFKEQIRENILNTISKIHVGDSLILILPSWQCNTGGTLRVNTSNSSTPLIYGIKLKEKITDPKDYEKREIDKFIMSYNDTMPEIRRFKKVDTLSNYFYFRYIDITGRGDTLIDVAQDQKTITVEYAGYFTDGFMFDSNINKLLLKQNPTIDTTSTSITTANSSKSTFTYYADSTKFSAIRGWHKAFQLLKKGDKAEFFFSSDYGYGIYGNTTIFGYTPLRFYIYIKDVN